MATVLARDVDAVAYAAQDVDIKRPSSSFGPSASNEKKPWHGDSMYPKLMRDLLDTVLKHEAFLFTEAERRCIEQFNALPYNCRYLLTRLVLRVRTKVHRLSDLEARYGIEFDESMQSTIETICDTESPVDAEDEDPGNVVSNANKGFFAINEERLDSKQLLESLKADEIKEIAIHLKAHNPKFGRAEQIKHLLSRANTQTTLSFASIPRQKPVRYTTPPPKPLAEVIDLITPPPIHATASNQMTRLREMVLSIESKFILLSSAFFDLLQRVNLVYFRSTVLESNSMLLPLILTRSRKRSYPTYPSVRTPDLFQSRTHLLAYERALKIEADMETLLMEPISREQKGVAALRIYEEAVPRWRELVNQLDTDPRYKDRPALERFEEGHVLTRVVFKGREALSMLNKYGEEASLLRELLGQRRWRKSRRGEWYDRLALVLMQHLKCPEEAMRVVVEGLKDDLTHSSEQCLTIHSFPSPRDLSILEVVRPQLSRRLARLEKRLNVPEDARHVCAGAQRRAEERHIEGKRVRDDQTKFIRPSPSPFQRRVQSVSAAPQSNGFDVALRDRAGVHSVWQSRKGTNVTVEEFVLEHYEKLGFRGYHSEGRIVRHIFLLLFWSILFLPVEGAFETPFQIAPLDIAHDSFYHARREQIEKRLAEIENGEGPRIAGETDDEERPNGTFAIGSRWDAFTKEDAMEVIECIGGTPLSAICRLMCEDYVKRASGVPDLLVWNHSQRTVKFVEVKGPGDRLMETQKVWIDALLRAGIDVEVCHVKEFGVPDVKAKKNNTKKVKDEAESSGKDAKKRSGTSSKVKQEEPIEVESEDEPGATVAASIAQPHRQPPISARNSGQLPLAPDRQDTRSEEVRARSGSRSRSVGAAKKEELNRLLGNTTSINTDSASVDSIKRGRSAGPNALDDETNHPGDAKRARTSSL